MDRNTEALVAAILTIAKFLPNVTYASETVATEFQQMLEEVRKIRPSPDRAAVPPDRATARRLDELISSFTLDELHRLEELVHRFLGTDHLRWIHVIHDDLYPSL